MKTKNFLKRAYLSNELEPIVAVFKCFFLDMTSLKKRKWHYNNDLKVNNGSVIVKLHKKDTIPIKFTN
ncbi:hypothetical protein FP668_04560 [Listeria monocytogenes]|nr:hypothetical protein [Listeria monocytogenes]